MLLLAAIAHFIPGRAQQSEEGALALNPAIGHIGLTIIALVYVPRSRAPCPTWPPAPICGPSRA
jgi:hypothetical protein